MSGRKAATANEKGSLPARLQQALASTRS